MLRAVKHYTGSTLSVFTAAQKTCRLVPLAPEDNSMVSVNEVATAAMEITSIRWYLTPTVRADEFHLKLVKLIIFLDKIGYQSGLGE